MAGDFRISNLTEGNSVCQPMEKLIMNRHCAFNTSHENVNIMDEEMDSLLCLPPEDELGNVEYKSSLINPSANRIQHLSTQMKWRLREGDGQAIYEIGVSDNGTIVGLNEKEMEASLNTLRKMASCIRASVTVLKKRPVRIDPNNPDRYAVELLIRKLPMPDDHLRLDLRLAILGSAESGKSTLCGVLTQGELDNGNGQTRINLFRHLHEFRTGKTSSICLDVIGFSDCNHLINYKEFSLEELLEESYKVITLIDLAGDRKYLRTTIYGVSGYNPHYCALVINARTGPTAVTKEHLGLVVALEIQFFVIVTKIDLVGKEHLKRVMDSIENLLDGLGKDLIVRQIDSLENLKNFTVYERDLVPVLSISNVTGQGLPILTTFLAQLPDYIQTIKPSKILSEMPLFCVEEVFQTERLGIITCGLLIEGAIHEGDSVKFGPTKTGDYLLCTVDSIHKCKQPVLKVRAGETASLALSIPSLKSEVPKKGMVLIGAGQTGACCRRFVARFYLLYHPYNEICVGFQGTVFIGSLMRTVTIVDFDAPSICACRWMTVTFEFQKQPEFVRAGMPLIFRECRTKAMGEILWIDDKVDGS